VFKFDLENVGGKWVRGGLRWLWVDYWVFLLCILEWVVMDGDRFVEGVISSSGINFRKSFFGRNSESIFQNLIFSFKFWFILKKYFLKYKFDFRKTFFKIYL